LGVVLTCVIAMSSAFGAAENKPTDADKQKLSSEIQNRYKPGKGLSSSTSPMSSSQKSAAGTCGGTGQIAACSASCSAACIFQCFPSLSGGPWSSACHSCVNGCMDKCTGCGPGTLN
jgi:hypothetical protein